MNELPKQEGSTLWWWVIGIIIIIVAGGVAYLFTINNSQTESVSLSANNSTLSTSTPKPSAITTTEIDSSITQADAGLKSLDETTTKWNSSNTGENELGL